MRTKIEQPGRDLITCPVEYRANIASENPQVKKIPADIPFAS